MIDKCYSCGNKVSVSLDSFGDEPVFCFTCDLKNKWLTKQKQEEER